jgi:hypothetical protein
MVYCDKPDGADYFNEVIYKSGEYYLVFSGTGGNYVMDLYYPPESHSKAELLIKGLKKKNLCKTKSKKGILSCLIYLPHGVVLVESFSRI